MTPILRNRAVQPDGFGHHGYWVVDFTEIDPHFGSNDDLKSLINAAHERNIKVFFDIITNHTADVIKYKECHDSEGNFLAPDQTGCEFISSEDKAKGKKYTPFFLDGENNRGDSFWQGESAIKGDFVGLDDIDTSQPEVITGLSEVFKDLISEFKPDGFRIDTVKHVDIEFWQSFGPAIVNHAQDIGIPEFFIFGEVYDGNPAGLSKFTTLGKLPSVLDFGFAFNVKDVLFTDKSPSQLSKLFDNDDYYRDADSSPNDLLNFIANHDIGRVGHFLQQGLPDISEDEMLKRSQLAHSLMYFSRGVPVVYYGDEQGFTGDGGDVDARENMDPSEVDVYNDNKLIGTDQTTADDNFNVDHPLYKHIAGLAKIRRSHLNLRRGEHINRSVDEQKRVYAFSRIVPPSQSNPQMQDVLIAFNLSTTPQNLALDSMGNNYRHLAGNNDIVLSDSAVTFNLPALSYTIVESVNTLAHAKVTEINIGQQYAENDRIFIPVDISFESSAQLNVVALSFYGKLENGQYEQFASDISYPYRAVVVPETLEKYSHVKVIVDNFDGQQLEARKDLRVQN
jgi:glycosidase